MGGSIIIHGQIFGREDLTIDGEVEGAVELQEGRLVVGLHGKVRASVKARSVVVLGAIYGNVEATDSIEIRNNARLVGDISTRRITIEDGAYFKGAVSIVDSVRKDDRVELEDRYAQLVEKKFLNGLSHSEEIEMETLAARLSDAEADFYEPILHRLRNEERATVRENVVTREETT